LVHFGPLEEIKVPKNGQCLFISFLNGAVAAAFLADAHVKKIAVRGNALHVNMAREQPWMNREVVNAVMTQEATRTVYIPNIDPEMSEDEISQEMRAFGDVDIVKVVRNQQNAFVHFFSIKKAMEVVERLRKSGKYCRDGKQVGFGKVRFDASFFEPKLTVRTDVHSYPRPRRTMSKSQCDKRAWLRKPKSVEHISETCTLPIWQSTTTQPHLTQCGQDRVRVHSVHQTSITLDPIMGSARPSGLCSSVISPNQPQTRICVMSFGVVTLNISDTYQLSSVL
jgi:hypothetical protein